MSIDRSMAFAPLSCLAQARLTRLARFREGAAPCEPACYGARAKPRLPKIMKGHLAGWLLLGQAVKRAQAQYQVDAVDADDLAIGEQARQGINRHAVG